MQNLKSIEDDFETAQREHPVLNKKIDKLNRRVNLMSPGEHSSLQEMKALRERYKRTLAKAPGLIDALKASIAKSQEPPKRSAA